MGMIVYDGTNFPDIHPFVESMANRRGLMLEEGTALANLSSEALSGNVLFLSDERFDGMSDAAILQALKGLAQTGAILWYLGTVRDDVAFETELRSLGCSVLLVESLEPDELVHWLEESLQKAHTAQTGRERRETSPPLPSPSASSKAHDAMGLLVSGLPGAGTSFVALSLASTWAEQAPCTLVEAGFRPTLSTWLGEESGEALLHFTHPIRRGPLTIRTRNPFDEGPEPSLRACLDTMDEARWVLDVALQDYLTWEHPAAQVFRVLVLTADMHHLRMTEGLTADAVVINRCPSHLPLDREEYTRYFPDATMVFWAWEERQAEAIVRGEPLVTHGEALKGQCRALLQSLEEGKRRVFAGSLGTS